MRLLPRVGGLSVGPDLEPGRVHHRGRGRVRLLRRKGQPAGQHHGHPAKKAGGEHLFDQLGKTGSREAVTAAGDYLSGALYALLRQLYRRGGGNEDFFAVSPGDYDGGLVQADMTMSQVRYRRALSQAEEVQEITPDTLTAGYPGLGQSVAQVIHNTDERCKSLQ